MKMKLIATVLLLATLLGCFGCAAISAPTKSADEREQPNFIGGATLLNDGVKKPTDFLNLAEKDEYGKAKFKLVYPANTANSTITEYKRLTDEVVLRYTATLDDEVVTLEVGHFFCNVCKSAA